MAEDQHEYRRESSSVLGITARMLNDVASGKLSNMGYGSKDSSSKGVDMAALFGNLSMPAPLGSGRNDKASSLHQIQ